MRLIECDQDQLEEIRVIFNEVIANSTALYDYSPRSSARISEWWRTKREGGFPVLGLIDERNALAGFATYGVFRPFPAYRYTVEHSLYVAASYRGQGLGGQLLEALIERAERDDYHVLVGVIDSANAASIALHQRYGFLHAGRLSKVGYKFGRWLDVDLYQRTLSVPEKPTEE